LQKKSMAILRTILVLFIIFYLVRLFTRYLLPGLFVNYVDSKMGEFRHKQQQQQKRQKEQAKKHEGEVTIDYSPGVQRKNKPSKGDYIDYVEVKD